MADPRALSHDDPFAQAVCASNAILNCCFFFPGWASTKEFLDVASNALKVPSTIVAVLSLEMLA